MILHSTTHFDKAAPYLIFHRALSASVSQATQLSAALTNHAAFAGTVPGFLRSWSGDGDRLGLDALATAIEAPSFAGNSGWRFAVTPLPPRSESDAEHYFEAWLPLNLAEVMGVRADGPAAAALGQMGEVDEDFYIAFRALLSRLAEDPRYPGAAAVLNAVILSPPTAGASAS